MFSPAFIDFLIKLSAICFSEPRSQKTSPAVILKSKPIIHVCIVYTFFYRHNKCPPWWYLGIALCCCHMCEDSRVRRARNLCLSLSCACSPLSSTGLSWVATQLCLGHHTDNMSGSAHIRGHVRDLEWLRDVLRKILVTENKTQISDQIACEWKWWDKFC